MSEYAMFLRGINVGGVRVPMPQLRETLSALGARDVRTWLATGNVMLDFDGSGAELKARAEAALAETFNYEAYVLLRSRDELMNILAAWPFSVDDASHRYVVFSGAHAAEAAANLTLTPGEQVSTYGDELFWLCPKGSSTQTPLAKLLAKKTYKATTTTRNLNTIEKMVA